METDSSAMGRLARDHYLMSDHSRRSDAVPTQQLLSLFNQSPQRWGLLFSCVTTKQGAGNRVWTELSYINDNELMGTKKANTEINTQEVSGLTLLALYERLWATDIPAFKQLVRSKIQNSIKLESRKSVSTKPHSVPKQSQPIEPEAAKVKERQNIKPLNKIRGEKVVQPQKNAQPAQAERSVSKQKQLMFSQQEKKPQSKMQIEPEVRNQDSDSEQQYYRPKAPSAKPKEQHDLISSVSTVAEEQQHPNPPASSQDRIEEEDEEAEQFALLARLMEQQKNSSPPKSVTPSPAILPPRALLPAKEVKPLPKIKGQATLNFMIKKAA